MTSGKDKKYDVFVSYAHVDNEPQQRDGDPWVEEFTRQLTLALNKTSGCAHAVWRDPAIGGSRRFDAVIEEALDESVLFLALISPRYLRSINCRKEVDFFRAVAEREGGLSVGSHHSRIVPVLLYNLEREEWEHVSGEVAGFALWEPTEVETHTVPMDPRSRAFSIKTMSIAYELHRAVAAFRGTASKAAPAERPTPAPPGSERPTGAVAGQSESETEEFQVYVSASADDLRPTKIQITERVVEEGMSVVQGVPPPRDDEHEEAAHRAIAGADLSVHLLGALPGEPFGKQPEKTYPVEQARIGRDHARSQLILIPDDFDPATISDAAYGEFLTELENAKRAADRLEIVRANRFRMADTVIAKAKQIKDARCKEHVVFGESMRAFVDLHPSDLRPATELVSYLTGQKIATAMLSDDDESASMDLFEDLLSKAFLYIVVFGSVTREWVVHRLIEAQKLVLVKGYETHIGVYVAPPGKRPKDTEFKPFDVVINSEEFDPETLEPLIQRASAKRR